MKRQFSLIESTPFFALFTLVLHLVLASFGLGAELQFSGTFQNTSDWSGNFPPDAAFSLELDYDENAQDFLEDIPNSPSSDYAQLVRSVDFRVASSDFTSAGSTVSLSFLRIRRDQAFGRWVANLRITLTDGEGKSVVLALEWVDHDRAVFGKRNLAEMDLSTSGGSRYIWFNVAIAPEGALDIFTETAAFAFFHPTKLDGSPKPDFRASGHDELLVFGDSLSSVSNDAVKTADDEALFYESGQSNGPNWVQLLAARLGVTHRPEQNFARFGGGASYSPGDLPAQPTVNSIATFWDNSENWRAFSVLGINPLLTFEVITLGAEERTARGVLDFVDQMDYLGVGNAIVLGPVDFGFAPGARRNFDTPEKRQKLRNLIVALNAGVNTMVQATAARYKSTAQVYLDPNQYLDKVLEAPGDYGITNTTDNVLTHSGAGGGQFTTNIGDVSLNGPGASYFFWTASAPTTRVHEILQEFIHEDAFSGGVSPAPAQSVGVATVTGLVVNLTANGLVIGESYSLVRTEDFTTERTFTTFQATDSSRSFLIPRDGHREEFYFLRTEP